MSAYWRRELIKLFIFLLITLSIGAIEGIVPGLFFLCAVLFLGNLSHLRNLAAMVKWLPRADTTLVPQGTGAWEEPFALLYRLVRRSQTSKDQLSEALTRFQNVAAAMPDGVLILDAQDRIEWCNPNAERHFGLSLGKDRGSQLTYLVRQPEFLSYLSEQKYAEPLVLRSVRNNAITLSVQLVPYSDDAKLIISRDITQWEKAETARRDFVANVSHELRTPITVVGGFVETLADTQNLDPAVLKRSLSLMREQTTRMHRLVEDLLTLSKLESGPPSEDENQIDMYAMVAALAREAEQLSNGKHRIKTEVASERGLIGSAGELRSAFSNLVSNAVRYTPAGGEITIIWKGDQDRATFAVQDCGVGIAPEHIPRLTERFYRVDRGRSRETGGTGLGLAIVKHVLNRHQAKLEISSEVGRGSRFAAVFSAGRLVAPQKQRAVAVK